MDLVGLVNFVKQGSVALNMATVVRLQIIVELDAKVHLEDVVLLQHPHQQVVQQPGLYKVIQLQDASQKRSL